MNELIRHEKQDALKAKAQTWWGQTGAGRVRSGVAELNTGM